MGKVTTGFLMPLDGFVARLNDNPHNSLEDSEDSLFKWYFAGDTAEEIPLGEGVMKMNRECSEMAKESAMAAIVSVTAGGHLISRLPGVEGIRWTSPWECSPTGFRKRGQAGLTLYAGF